MPAPSPLRNSMRAVRSLRLSPAAFRWVSLASVWAVALIIVTGAAVRVTDSGLGCPDWPSCFQHQFVAAWRYHAVIEFTNRLFTVLVTVAVAAALVGSLLRRPRRADLVWLSGGLVAGVLGQVVLGGLTVLFKLAPPLVMAHFVLSVLLLWDAAVLHHRAGRPDTAPRAMVPRELLWLSRLLVATTAVVIVAGTAVTGSGPHAGSAKASRLPVAFRSAAELHADLVMLLIGMTLATLVAVHVVGAPAGTQRRGRLLLEVMAAQGALGFSQYFLQVPSALVELHVIGAVAVWVAVLRFHLGLFARPPAPAGRDVEPEPLTEQALATT